MKKKTISFAVTEEMKQEVCKICKDTDQKLSDYMRSALALKSMLSANSAELLVLASESADLLESNRETLDTDLYRCLYAFSSGIIKLISKEDDYDSTGKS